MKRSDVEGLAYDLLHIEVVTFVVDSIDLSFRRLDDSGLATLRAQLRTALVDAGTPVKEGASFEELSAAGSTRDDALGRRVAEVAGRVQQIMHSPQGKRSMMTLGPHERIELRRIMEIGAQRCAARTVISLSGDVTNHLHTEYADNAGVQAAHGRAVQVVVSLWDDLVRTLSSFISSLATGLLRR